MAETQNTEAMNLCHELDGSDVVCRICGLRYRSFIAWKANCWRHHERELRDAEQRLRVEQAKGECWVVAPSGAVFAYLADGEPPLNWTAFIYDAWRFASEQEAEHQARIEAKRLPVSSPALELWKVKFLENGSVLTLACGSVVFLPACRESSDAGSAE